MSLPLRLLRPLSVVCVTLALAACAPQPVPPPPPVPAPPPPAPPPQAEGDWRDVPLTPGDWRYRQEPGGSAASFADGRFEIRCDAPARIVRLSQAGAGTGAASMGFTTSSGAISYPASTVGARVVAQLAASDPGLDKIAFSRGRFVVAVPGQPRLIVPAWPEFARVIEDCRRPG